jgi:hypothetical protein
MSYISSLSPLHNQNVDHLDAGSGQHGGGGHDGGHGGDGELAALQRRAATLGCYVEHLGENLEDASPNSGPFGFFCEDRKHLIWPFGLSLADLHGALDCLEREHALHGRSVGDVWDEEEAEAWKKKVQEVWANFAEAFLKKVESVS